MNLLNNKYLITKKIKLTNRHKMRMAINKINNQEVILKFFVNPEYYKNIAVPENKIGKEYKKYLEIKEIIDKSHLNNELSFFEAINKSNKKCPYIIELLDKFEYKDMLVLVYPFYKRGDLYEFVKQHGTFTNIRTKGIIKKVIKGIKYMHELGYIYRDLKSENIVLKQNGDPVIIDFDLIINISELIPLKNGLYKDIYMCGTPHTMPPETKHKIYSKKTDVWSIGCIAHFLYTEISIESFYNQETNQYISEFSDDRLKYASYDYLRGTKSPTKDMIDFFTFIFTLYNDRPSIDDLIAHPWIINELTTNYFKKNLSNQEIKKYML